MGFDLETFYSKVFKPTIPSCHNFIIFIYRAHFTICTHQDNSSLEVIGISKENLVVEKILFFTI